MHVNSHANFHSLLDAEIKTWTATSFALFPFVQFTEIICVCVGGQSLLKVWEDDRELNDKESKKKRKDILGSLLISPQHQ